MKKLIKLALAVSLLASTAPAAQASDNPFKSALGVVTGIPVGVMVGGFTGGITGVVNGVATGAIVGWNDPLTNESYSAEGSYIDYDSYNFDHL